MNTLGKCTDDILVQYQTDVQKRLQSIYRRKLKPQLKHRGLSADRQTAAPLNVSATTWEEHQVHEIHRCIELCRFVNRVINLGLKPPFLPVVFSLQLFHCQQSRRTARLGFIEFQAGFAFAKALIEILWQFSWFFIFLRKYSMQRHWLFVLCECMRKNNFWRRKPGPLYMYIC